MDNSNNMNKDNDPNSQSSNQLTSNELKENEKKEGYDKLTHDAAKGLATYYGGAAGTKAYDIASQTELGKKVEKSVSKAVQATSNPILDKGVKVLNDSGALDMADQAISVAGGSKGNQIDNKMLKGAKAQTSNSVNNNQPSDLKNINQNRQLVKPPAEFENSEEINKELQEQQLEEQQLLEEQLQEEQERLEQEKENEKKKNNTIKGIVNVIINNPILVLVLLVGLMLIISLFILLYMMAADMDIVGTEITDYSEAEIISGYCNQIILVKEHDDFTGAAVSSIDEVDLTETFILNKVSTPRWETEIYDLETYVKGVVQAEAIDVKDKKTYEVAAIAARTYALQITNGKCYTWNNSNKRTSYRNPQSFTSTTVDSDVETAVSETSGLVVTLDDNLLNMDNGNYYDYFCHIGKDVDKEEHVFYQMLQENEEERLLLPIDWVKANIPLDDYNKSGKYDGQCQKEGMSLFGAKYLLTKEADPYTTMRIIKYYYGYDTVLKRIQTQGFGSCGDFSLISTTLSRDEFISLVNQFNSNNSNFQVLKTYAGEIYDISVANNFNPELVYARAQVEGYSPGGSTYNYYGIGCSNNGKGKDCAKYASVMNGVLAYMKIMKGYGVNTLFDVYNIKHYAYIGDYWITGSSSKGGCYYLPYIAKYYKNQTRYNIVKAACDSGNGSFLKTNVEDQEAYSYYQIEKMVEARKNIFNIDSTNCDLTIGDIDAILNSDASIGVKAASLAVAMFDNFGYSQANRWGDNQVDCSSLIYRTYIKLGINFGGGSTVKNEYDWCKKNNRMISEKQLQPGDLLFTKDLGHVEMYIGNNQRFGAHSARYKWEDQVSIQPYKPGYFVYFCRPY